MGDPRRAASRSSAGTVIVADVVQAAASRMSPADRFAASGSSANVRQERPSAHSSRCPASAASTKRRAATRLGNMTTQSVRRRISLSASWRPRHRPRRLSRRAGMLTVRCNEALLRTRTVQQSASSPHGKDDPIGKPQRSSSLPFPGTDPYSPGWYPAIRQPR